ncbi:MAG: enoyl-CoA hydratase/isomerase family protein [Comamonadaceae bacterium]|nr:enoyl-CoA hydratase/isomerase family protein [Comamonadaceae bacterium]
MTVHYQLRGPVAWIRIDRPEALNALDIDTLQALESAFLGAEIDPAARVVVLTGTGRAFSAGGDIHQLLREMDGAIDAPSYIDSVSRAFTAVRALGKPLIGCVNGLAVGGGLELALHCDLVVASECARLGDGHSNFGIFPGGGSSAMLPRRMSLNQAKDLLFSGRLLSAYEWQQMGIVNRLVPLEKLESQTQALADELATRSPVLLRRLKASANTTNDMPLHAALQEELQQLRAQMTTNDMREGTSAFVEKRVPHYTGT